MPDELEERLKSHARAFDSLLSLIPAKLYYGEDNSDQWQRKKQTPEQKRAAKMAKLDPDNWKSAKDVMDERAAAALKRKRDDDDGEEDGADISALEDIEREAPKAQLDAVKPKSKKRKVEAKNAIQTDDTPTIEETEEEKKRRKALKKAEKRERKQEKKTKAKEKQERQKAKKNGTEPSKSSDDSGAKKIADELLLKEPINLAVSTSPQVGALDDTASTASSEGDEVEVFSPHHESGTSSISSIQQASIEEPMKPQQSDSQPDNDSSQKARERLQAAISQLRAERKADGADGRAPKNRQELLEQRRQKEEARKAAKKEQRRREKEEETRREEEEIERRFSPGGSGSLLASPRSPMAADAGSPTSSSSYNFSFGRIAFEDGTQFDPTIGALDDHKKKGPRDTAAELKAAQAKKARLAGLDEEKRLNIEEKDMWLNAKRRAHGDHVRDDTSLLKKALKRQQGQKRKSEREWTERTEGVQKSQEARQKKRNENLAKRKEDKRSSSGGGKKVRRPGFEGSFKGRTGGKRKA